VSKPIYTDQQLEQFKADNAKGYTFPNGKHLTMYECTQHQRMLERKIRYAKEGKIGADASGDAESSAKYKAKVKKLTKQYNTFSKGCGLKPKPERTRVDGYKS